MQLAAPCRRSEGPRPPEIGFFHSLAEKDAAENSSNIHQAVTILVTIFVNNWVLTVHACKL
jgi:hypothetical protein